MPLFNPASQTIDLYPGDFHLTGGAPSGTLTAGGRYTAWLFDASSEEQIGTNLHLPPTWGAFQVDLDWCNHTVDAGDVVWRVDTIFNAAAADLSSGSLTGTTTTVTADTQYKRKVTTLSSSIAVTSGGLLSFRIRRLATDVGDTKANDAALTGVLLTRVG